MRATHYRSCTLCEATSGVAIDVEGDQVVAVRGDDEDPFSRGYIGPKATALADPPRHRRPASPAVSARGLVPVRVRGARPANADPPRLQAPAHPAGRRALDGRPR